MASLYQRRNIYSLEQRYGRRDVTFLKFLGQQLDPATGNLTTENQKYPLPLVCVFEKSIDRRQELGRDPAFMQYDGFWDRQQRLLIFSRGYLSVEILPSDRFLIGAVQWGVVKADVDRDVFRVNIISLLGSEVIHG